MNLLPLIQSAKTCFKNKYKSAENRGEGRTLALQSDEKATASPSCLSKYSAKPKNPLLLIFITKPMYYILFYKTVDNYIEKRAPYRREHLSLAQAASESGHLVMAGALADPPDGAVLIFKGDSPKVAEDFAKNDPYVKNGLISEWHVRPWTVVVGES